MSIEIQIINSALCKFIGENLVAEGIEVHPDTTLDHLGLDSFSIIEIILYIERKFGIELPDGALTKENVFSVATLSECVIKHST